MPRIRASGRVIRVAFAAVLAAHAGLTIAAGRANFVVVDEVGHVAAGVSHWQTGTFDLYRVNPPLVRMIAALPVLAAGPEVDYRRKEQGPCERGEWYVGIDFARANGPRYFRLVQLARLTTLAWSLIAAAFIYAWAGRLYGPAGGLLGATLWCADTTVSAFAQVVTNDVPAAAATIAACHAFWSYRLRPSPGRLVAAGLLLGVAQLTKFTEMLLVPAFVSHVLVGRFEPPDGRRRPLAREIGELAFLFLMALAVLNLGYGFRGSLRPLGTIDFASETFAGASQHDPSGRLLPGNRARGTWLAVVPVPVPADYLSGIDLQRRDFEGGMASYMAGEWSERGWYEYYLYALAVKEPPGTLALVAWALVDCLARPSRSRRGDAERLLILTATTILVGVSSQAGFSHHMRYILPAFPPAFVLCGRLAREARRRRAWAWIVLALVAWTGCESVRIWPHSMSFFNAFAGGPENGDAHLLESNLDWGQDLTHLKRWMETHPEARPMHLAYYNLLDPGLIGIDFELPPPGRPAVFPDDAAYDADFGPRSGYFAVSVCLLAGKKAFVPTPGGDFRSITRRDYYAYFGEFTPIARAGYSIRIYHISPEQADAARARLGMRPWRPGPSR